MARTIVFALMFAVAVVGIISWIRSQPKCVRRHTEIVHVPRRKGFVLIGKVPVAYDRPAHDEEQTVCDEYEKR